MKGWKVIVVILAILLGIGLYFFYFVEKVPKTDWDSPKKESLHEKEKISEKEDKKEFLEEEKVEKEDLAENEEDEVLALLNGRPTVLFAERNSTEKSRSFIKEIEELAKEHQVNFKKIDLMEEKHEKLKLQVPESDFVIFYYDKKGNLKKVGVTESDYLTEPVSKEAFSRSLEQLKEEKRIVDPLESIPDNTNINNVIPGNRFDGKKTLVTFYAGWCPDCQKITFAFNKLIEDYKEKVHIIECDLTEEDISETVFFNSMEVENIPYFIIYDEKGDLLYRTGDITDVYAYLDEEEK